MFLALTLGSCASRGGIPANTKRVEDLYRPVVQGLAVKSSTTVRCRIPRGPFVNASLTRWTFQVRGKNRIREVHVGLSKFPHASNKEGFGLGIHHTDPPENGDSCVDDYAEGADSFAWQLGSMITRQTQGLGGVPSQRWTSAVQGATAQWNANSSFSVGNKSIYREKLVQGLEDMIRRTSLAELGVGLLRHDSPNVSTVAHEDREQAVASALKWWGGSCVAVGYQTADSLAKAIEKEVLNTHKSDLRPAVIAVQNYCHQLKEKYTFGAASPILTVTTGDIAGGNCISETNGNTKGGRTYAYVAVPFKVTYRRQKREIQTATAYLTRFNGARSRTSPSLGFFWNTLPNENQPCGGLLQHGISDFESGTRAILRLLREKVLRSRFPAKPPGDYLGSFPEELTQPAFHQTIVALLQSLPRSLSLLESTGRGEIQAHAQDMAQAWVFDIHLWLRAGLIDHFLKLLKKKSYSSKSDRGLWKEYWETSEKLMGFLIEDDLVYLQSGHPLSCETLHIPYVVACHAGHSLLPSIVDWGSHNTHCKERYTQWGSNQPTEFEQIQAAVADRCHRFITGTSSATPVKSLKPMEWAELRGIASNYLHYLDPEKIPAGREQARKEPDPRVTQALLHMFATYESCMWEQENQNVCESAAKKAFWNEANTFKK